MTMQALWHVVVRGGPTLHVAQSELGSVLEALGEGKVVSVYRSSQHIQIDHSYYPPADPTPTPPNQ